MACFLRFLLGAAYLLADTTMPRTVLPVFLIVLAVVILRGSVVSDSKRCR